MFTSNPHSKRLSVQDVHRIRELYFIRLEKLDTLSKEFNISITTLKKAIHAQPPYHTIEDSIHDAIKKNRKPARLTSLGAKKYMKQNLISQEMERKRELQRGPFKEWEEFNK